MFAWGLAHLLHHAEYLDKIWAELDEQIGGRRMVTMADRPKLPYINAVVNVSMVN
jgi:cytochrome P450